MRGSVLKRCEICIREGKEACRAGKCHNPIYYIAYRFNGKQKRETIGTNKKVARKILEKRLAQIIMGEYSEVKDIKFQDFVKEWLENHAKPRIKPSTFYNYENTIKTHLIPAFKDRMIPKIDSGDIRSLLAGIIKSRSPKTVNNILVMCKTMFKHARRWGYIKTNPAEDIDNFKVEHKEMGFLSPDEINLLLKHSRDPFRTLFFVAVMTGMRRGEVLGLQWGDIDWNSDTIFVRRSLYWISNKGNGTWKFIAPKSKRSIRAIAMSPRLKEALQIHRITSGENQHDLVFANKQGNPIDPNNMIKREFLSALRFAGLRKIRFHDLRHTYCTLLISQGENTKFIQNQLGHASIQTTMDRYGHLFPADNKGVGSRLDSQVFGQNVQQKVTNLEVINQNENSVSMQ